MRLSKGRYGPVTLPHIRSANRTYSKQICLDFPMIQISEAWAFSFTDSDISIMGIVTCMSTGKHIISCAWWVAHHTRVPSRLSR